MKSFETPESTGLSRGMESFGRGRYEQSIRELDEAIAADAGVGAHLFRGLAHQVLGHAEAAAADLERVAAWEPEDPDGLLLKALAFRALGRPSEAGTLIGRAAEAEPGSPRWRLKIAEVCRRTGDLEGALVHLGAAGDLDPNTPLYSLLRAETLLEMGRAADVDLALQAAVQLDPASIDVRLRAAEVSIRLGDNQAALRYLDGALALKAGDAGALALQAEVWMGLGMTDRALRSLFRAQRAEPGSARLRCRSAEVLLQRGAYGAALKAVNRALDCDPDLARALTLSARLRLWRGEWDLALAGAERALRIEPRNADALRVRAAVSVQLGSLRQALRDLKGVLRLRPDDAEAYAWRAQLYWRNGRPRKALLDVGKAHRESEALPVHVLRALILLDLDDPVWALEWKRVRDELSASMPDPQAQGVARDGARRFLEQTLARLGGNLSHPATFAESEGGCTRLVAANPPVAGFRLEVRQMVKSAQQGLRFKDLSFVLKDFELIGARNMDPVGRALFHCYRGEIFLWVGRLSEAEADFQRAIGLNMRTKWAYVGLCGVHVLRGETAAALDKAAAAERFGAFSVRVWRGEALRRAGESRAAAVELERAFQEKPSRVGGVINLALVRGDLGDEAGMAALAQRAAALAPSLFDAAQAAGGADVPSRSGAFPTRTVLERCLELLQGNRSSWMDVFFTPDGARRRFAAPGERN